MAMFHQERDFRALIFSSEKLTSIEAVIRLLEDQPALGKPKRINVPTENESVKGCRVTYFSRNCFIRTFDPAKKKEFEDRKKQGIPFEYEVYVFVDRRSSPPLVLVGIPFADMAREFFGRIHDRRDDSFEYHRPRIQEVVASLSAPASTLIKLRTVGLNWLIAGDAGRSDQITLRGSNVLQSDAFARVTHAMEGLNFVIRKMQVRYDDKTGHERLKFAFDRFGNFSIWVTDEGANLPALFDVMDRLKKKKLVARESKFPVKNRIEDVSFPSKDKEDTL